MKGINYQCVYRNIDNERYPYTAFNLDGSLTAFVNPPVRNYDMGIWVDSVTGYAGDLVLFEAWDQSMRETDEMADCRIPRSRFGTKSKPSSNRGKKGIQFSKENPHEC